MISNLPDKEMQREQARKERAMAAKATDRPAGDLALRQQPLFAPPVKGRGGGDKVHQVLGRFDDMKSIMLDNQYDFLGVQQQPDTPAAASRKHSFTPIPSSSSTKPMLTPVSCEFKQSAMRLNSSLTTNSGGSSGSSKRPVAAVPEGHVRGSGERHPASSSRPNSGPMRTSTLSPSANAANSEGRRREEQQIHFAARHSGTTPNRDADSAKQQRQQQHVGNLKSASSKPIPGALKVTMPAAEPEEEEKRAMATLNLSRTSIDSIEDVFKEMDLPVSSPITALPSHSPYKDSSFFPPHKSMTKPPSAKPASYEPASILDDLSLSSTDSSDSDDDVPPVTKASSAMKSPVATAASVKTSSPLATHTSQSLSSSSSSAPKPFLSFSKALPSTTNSEVPLKVKANDMDNKTGSSSRTLTNKALSLHLNIPAASAAAHADIAATSKSPLAGVMRSQPSVTFKTVSPSVVSTSVASTSIVSATAMSSSSPLASSRVATKPTPALAPSKSTSKVSITKKPNRHLSDSSGSSSSSDSDSDNDNDSIATDPGDAETAESTAVSHLPSPVPVQSRKESVGEEEAPVAEDTSAKDRNWSLGTWLQAANPVAALSKVATETKLTAGDEMLKSKSTKTGVKESQMKEGQKMKAKEQDARKDDKTPTKAQLKSASSDRSAEKSKKPVTAVDERSSEKTKKGGAIADLLSADKAKKNTSTANEHSNDTNKKSSSKSVVEDVTDSRCRSTSQSDAEVRSTSKKQDLKSSSNIRTSKDCKDVKDLSENQAKKNTGTKVSEVSKKDKVSNEVKTGEKRSHELPKPKKPESLNKQCSKEENIRQTLRENKTQGSVKRRKHSASYKSSEFISSDDSDDDVEPSVKHRKDTQTQLTKKSDSMSTVAATDSGLSLELPASVGAASSQKCLEDNNEEDMEPALKPVFHPKVGVSYENGRPEILVSIDLTRFQDILGSMPQGVTYEGLLAAASFDDGPPAKRPAMHDLRVAVVGPYKHSTALALSSSSDDIQLSHDARFAERLLPGIGGSVPLSPPTARMGDAGVAAPVNAAASTANNVVRFKMAAVEEVRTQVFPDVEPANLLSSRIPLKNDIGFDASDIAIAGGSGGIRMVDSGVEWASSSGDGHRWQVAAPPSGVDRTSYAPLKSAAMSFGTDNSGGASQGSQRGGSSQWTGKSLPPPTGGAGQRPPAAADKNGAEQNNSIEALLQLITRNRPDAADRCLQQATALKHEADKTSDGLLKQLKYTEAVVCFVLCGRAMENDSLSLAEPSRIFKMYDDTLRFVRNLVGHRTVSDNQTDTGDTAVARQLDREAKLVTLSYRLQALLYFRLYNIRRSETVKLKKVIDDYNKQGSKSSASRGAAVSLPSPSSPQPSPAGSVASVGSTGSAGDVRQASAGGVTVPSRIHSVTQQYIGHIHHLQQAHELWDQACMLATSPPHAAFFEELDRACGALTLHSGMTQLVRYVHAGLRRLKDMA